MPKSYATAQNLLKIAAFLGLLGTCQGAIPQSYRFPPRVTIDPADMVDLTPTQKEMDAAAAAILKNYGSTAADKTALKNGILDVTKAPYLATPDDDSDDDWQAIQQAVYDAMRFKAVCFFPSGKYSISRQISCPMPAIQLHADNPNVGDIAASWHYRCVLVGDRSGERPLIALKPDSPDFQDADKPRDVLHFWNVHLSDGGPTIDTTLEKPNSNFSQRLEYLAIDTGLGNPGAAGVYMWGAQRCVIEDVAVEANHSFAGLRGIPGSGGMVRGITVNGGRYGVYVAAHFSKSIPPEERIYAGGQAGATIVGATLSGQSESNLYIESVTGPLTVVGGDFKLSGSEAPNLALHKNRAWLNLIDARIERDSHHSAIQTAGGVYLGNVHVRGASTLVSFPKHPERNLAGEAESWTHIHEFSQSNESIDFAPHHLDGQEVGSKSLLAVETKASPPPADLWTRHWPAAAALPHPTASNVLDITLAPYNANGFDGRDDWSAIQNALDDAQRDGKSVFVPRGEFHITQPLVLPPDVALFGHESSYSVISAQDSPQNAFNDPERPRPMLDTLDDATATASVAKLSLLSPVVPAPQHQLRGAYGVRWRYGRHSYVRDTQFRYHIERHPVLTRYLSFPYIRIEGSGGGRWYGLQRPNKWDADEMTPDYRTILVKDTTEPLDFYMLNVTERTWDAPVSIEINRASNVTIYSLKHENSETGSPSYYAQALRATGADNLRIFGHSGNATQKTGDSMYEFVDCNNVLFTFLARMSLNTEPVDWSMLRDIRGDEETQVSGEKKLLFYKR